MIQVESVLIHLFLKFSIVVESNITIDRVLEEYHAPLWLLPFRAMMACVLPSEHKTQMMRYGHTFALACISIVATALLIVLLTAVRAEDNRNELGTPLDYGIPDELQLLKEEETVSIASRYEQPISQAPSNVYVITDEDIRHSGAVDLPTVLRRIPGMEIIQMSGADFNVSIRGNKTRLTGFNNSNVGEADIFGGEAGVEFIATSWLSGYATYTYQEVTQRSADRGAPRFKINAGARGLWENGFSAEINYFHVGSATYPIEGFFSLLPTPPDERVRRYDLLNLRAAYRFWQQQAAAGYVREAEVAVTAFNALNDTHKEHPLGDTIGSRVMGWLTMRY